MSDPHIEYFQVLAACLAAPPAEALVEALAARAGEAELGGAHPDLAAGWRELGAALGRGSLAEAGAAAAAAHRRLLGDPLGPALEPYASHYRDGARLGPSLAAFRGALREWGLVPDPQRFGDLEDHAAFQLDCLVQLGVLAEEDPQRWGEARRQCLAEHLLPWLPAFFADLEREARAVSDAGFYAGLARVGRGVLELEAVALEGG